MVPYPSFSLLTATTALTTLLTRTTCNAEVDFDMVSKIHDLRGEDKRLVMTDSYHEMDELRSKEDSVCNADLPKVISALTDSSDDSLTFLRGQAAALVSLCSISHAENRAKIGSEENVASSLVELIHLANEKWTEGKDASDVYPHLDVSAIAAEAIWNLAENSVENHKALVEAGAIPELGGFIMASIGEEGKACEFPGNNNGPLGRTPCHFMRMWSLAALERLSADYCHGTCSPHESHCEGECMYDWNEEETKLTVDPDDEGITIKVDSSAERETIANIDGLVDELISIVCASDSDREHGQAHPFPTESEVGRDDGMPSTVAWAAAGVLKNLALSDEVKKLITTDEVYKCLCAMSGSADWLEADRAQDALYYAGRQDECDDELEAKFFGEPDDDYYEGEESSDDEEAAAGHEGEL